MSPGESIGQHDTMPPLTRNEARDRAALLTVRSYTVHLDFTCGEEVFGSSTVIAFDCAEPGAETFVEIRPETLRGATLNGGTVDTSLFAEGRLPLSGLLGRNELRLDADMRYSRTGEGVHRFVDPADDEVYLYAMCGPDNAPLMFGCFDQPDLKAVHAISVTAPPHWTVLSNGAGERTAPGEWSFAETPPISPYLATIVAGALHSVYTSHDGIPLGLHCRRSLGPYLAADADELFDLTRNAFDRYHALFSERYPFGKYDQAFVPEFNFGAVENPGCVTFRDMYVFRSAVTEAERELRAMIVAHEMAHMWFGDLVTMEWWDDIWLNESFAEYMGYQVLTEVSRHTDAWTAFGVVRKPWGYDADQRPSTHPVAVDGLDDVDAALVNFDGISYAKGASALRQLVAWIGEQAFLAGVNDYFARHRFGNATLADLLDALARSSGRDVHGWAERWLRTTGVDTLRVEPDLSVTRTGSRPHRIRVGAYDLSDGGLVAREPVEIDVPGTDSGPPPWLDGRPRPDLLLINDHDLSYAKVRLDERSWRTVTESLSAVPAPLTRAVLWATARDMVRDAEWPAAGYVSLIADHLPAEPLVSITESVLAFAVHQVADRYVPFAARSGVLSTLTGVCRRLMDATPDLRLVAVRALIQCAETPEELAELRSWRQAGRLPDGPALDPELTWRILLRLCVFGEAGEDEIAAELSREPSAIGQEFAARCRSALPTPDAKARAWAAMFEGEPLSNNLLSATALGFWQPSHPEPSAPYVSRYFAEVPAAGARSPMIARILGRDLFPGYSLTRETVAAADECLSRTDLTVGMRRELVDRRDDLNRNIGIREAQEGDPLEHAM